MTNIKITPAPNLKNIASPEFRLNEFEAAIFNKGYGIVVENAMRCPCHALDAPLIDCQNCNGSGYFYINPTLTRGLITGINQNNKYKSWSEEMIGTIQVSVNEINKINLSYFDRITIKNESTYYSENLIIRRFDTNTFVFTTYKPINIISIHLFKSSSEKLIKMDPDDYEINPNNPYCIILSNSIIEEREVLSIYYKHELEYHIIDLPHDIRSSWERDKQTGQERKIRLPLQAVARRSHLIAVGKPNFDGSGIITNDNT